jgi:hypothetical protein
VFVPVHGMTTLERAAREMEIDGIFLDLLRTFEAQNRLVSDKAGRNYAPAVFAQEDVARKAGVTRGRTSSAFQQLRARCDNFRPIVA